MFDIGFSEVLLIFILALVVLGPEKLPKVAAQVGRWIGRARGMARQFREQLEEEVNLEEVRRAQSATPAPAASEPAESHPAPAELPPASQPEAPQPTYPDTHSHAHPTDDLGRPVPPSNPEPVVAESGQQDWVGGVYTEAQHGGSPGGGAVNHPATADASAQPTSNAGYAPPH